MRISDWSPDVCSSDLIDFLPSRKPNGIWSIPYSVRRGCLRFNGRLHGFRVLKLVASSLHLPLTPRARLFREWESLRTQPSNRSEERRGGKEGGSAGRSRWSPYHEKKKTKRTK